MNYYYGVFHSSNSNLKNISHLDIPKMIHINEEQKTALNLENEFIELLRRYVEIAHVPKQISQHIMCKDFIKNNPSYYTYYPHLFKNAFQIEDTGFLNTLSVAGFLYYKAVIVMDETFDTKSSINSFNSYLIADMYKEEAIKLLSKLFPSENLFWQSWNSRKLEYAKAYKIDQQSHAIKSYSDYEQLADYKCAFGKVAIDALYHLSGLEDENTYGALLNSHKLYYTAFQILDDIMDFREDIKNGQFNIAYFELEKRIGKAEILKKSTEDLKKLLYLNNVVNDLYDKALVYLASAKITIEEYDLNEWKYEIQKLHNVVIIHQLNVKGYMKVFFTKKKLSVTINNKKQSIEEVLQSGYKFIENSQGEEGNWEDYFNDAGISNVWTTGFIMSSAFLAESTIFPENIDKGIRFLNEQANSDSIWGYNCKWISDADTSTFVMLSFLKHGYKISNEALDNWYSYQNADGGFGTYNNEKAVVNSLNSDAVSDVIGWVQSHFCVSAAAYLFFCKAKINNTNFTSLRKYLIANLENMNNRYSYWWSEEIYSFSLLIKGSLLADDKEILALLSLHLESYMNSISYERIVSEKNYFYLGLLLECIGSSRDLFDKYRKQSKEISKILLSNQLDDGSWKENYSLRIPSPNIINPNDNDIVWKKGDTGTNILVSDFHRLFSTSTCLSGLLVYKNISQI